MMTKEECYNLHVLFWELDYLDDKISTITDDIELHNKASCRELLLKTENKILQSNGVINVIGRRAKFLETSIYFRYYDDEYFTIKRQNRNILEIEFDDEKILLGIDFKNIELI